MMEKVQGTPACTKASNNEKRVWKDQYRKYGTLVKMSISNQKRLGTRKLNLRKMPI